MQIGRTNLSGWSWVEQDRASTSPLWAAGAWILGARVVGAIAFAANNVVLARVLGPQQFGYFAVVSTAGVFAGFVAVAGVNRTLVKFIAVDRTLARYQSLAARQRISSRILVISIPTAAVLTFLSTLAVLRSFSPSTLLLALATTGLAVANGIQTLLGDTLRPYGHLRLASVVEGRSGGVLILLVHTVLLLPFLVFGLTLTGAVGLNVVAFALVLPAAGFLLHKHWVQTFDQAAREPQAVLDPQILPAFIKSSSVFLGTQLVAFLGAQGDIWIAGATLHPQDVSLFAAASRLMLLANTPLGAAQLALTPAIASLYASNKVEELQDLVRRTATLVTLPVLGLLLLIVLIPGTLLSFLFGAGFSRGAAALVWLSVGQLLNNATGLCGAVLAMSGREKDVLVTGFVVVGLKVCIGIPVALHWGLTAFAAESGVTTAALYLILLLLVRLRLGIWTYPARRVRFRSLLSSPLFK